MFVILSRIFSTVKSNFSGWWLLNFIVPSPFVFCCVAIIVYHNVLYYTIPVITIYMELFVIVAVFHVYAYVCLIFINIYKNVFCCNSVVLRFWMSCYCLLICLQLKISFIVIFHSCVGDDLRGCFFSCECFCRAMWLRSAEEPMSWALLEFL